MRLPRIVPLLLVLFLLHPGKVVADEGFFLEEEPIRFRLESNLTALKKQRGDNPQYMEGTVSYLHEEETGSIDVRIKARGNFRRKRSSCSFPPYWLNFKKKQVVETPFAGLNKVKVVSHCRDTKKPFEPYVYKEYLLYKTYNLLTDYSFRVRWAEIEYVDAKKRKKDPETFSAFLIEHVDAFAKRHRAKQFEERYVLPSIYDAELLCLAGLFQYFAGNSDFSFFASTDECCHNGKVFYLKSDPSTMIPVPYDFDLTGMVNAPYAVVNPKLPIESVRERLYRGSRTTNEVFYKTIELFKDKEEEIMDLWENADLLPDKVKAEAIDYIREFYAVLDDPEQLRIRIINKARSTEKLETTIESRIESQ